MSSRSVRLAALAALTTLGASASTACGEDELVCVDVDPACSPLYAPTWDNVYANTILPKCGTGGGACHEGASARGGLRLDDPVIAHQQLTDPAAGYVIVGDVSCSELIQRVNTASSSLLMPRGARLAASERCALAQWVLAGAPGPATTAAATARSEVRR